MKLQVINFSNIIKQIYQYKIHRWIVALDLSRAYNERSVGEWSITQLVEMLIVKGPGSCEATSVPRPRRPQCT